MGSTLDVINGFHLYLTVQPVAITFYMQVILSTGDVLSTKIIVSHSDIIVSLDILNGRL